ADRFDERDGRSGHASFSADVDDVQRADARLTRGARGCENAAPGRDLDQCAATAARSKEAIARFDLDDRALAERSDSGEEIVVAEDGAREEHARESPLERFARPRDLTHASGETAGHRRRTRGFGEDLEIREDSGLRSEEHTSELQSRFDIV